MQRIPVTAEDQMILKAIREECYWENLPKRLQATLSSKEEWHRRIIEHCIKKRLQWNSCFARKACKEGEYYEDMMRYLRKNLALFPYHLAEYVCRVMRISPFRYYRDMIFEVMRNEQPYDSIPNFSAADALRITGICRNEFIDIMNKCRSKKIMWKLNKSIARELLPTQPVDFAIEPWWGVCLVNFTLDEFKKLSEEEMSTIDKICKEANLFVLFDADIIKGLYRRGLTYFDVPVYPDDRFKVSRLEGFVSNREQSYEDPIEELLYAVFVVSSENATVAELATTLQADLSQLLAAASFACRLGWAHKLIDPASILQDSSTPGSLHATLSDEEDGSQISVGSASRSTDSMANNQQGDVLRADTCGPSSGLVRVALIVDANITSYLMMGSVSPGLKSHAVTLYEAGKLGDASIADLCQDLSTLEGTKFEGELQEFANHAFSLRCVLECLRSGGSGTTVEAAEVNNKLSIASSRNDVAYPTAGSIDADKSDHAGANGFGSSHHDSMHQGVSENSISAESLSAFLPEDSNINTCTDNIDSESNLQNDVNLIAVDGLKFDRANARKKKNYRVDILRCESLAALTPATLDKLFLRDYDIVLSMVPLPYTSVLPGPAGPVHFGPSSYLSMTPWMKLVLYSVMENGPLSVVLMKGQCLRLLPAPLACCEKALIWSWDGSAVGGLGGKLEGNMVKGSVLLHCLNSLLKYSAVLVLPLSRYDLDESGKIITVDIPLPLNNSDGSVAQVGEELGLSKDESSKLNSLLIDLGNKTPLPTIGYIRLLKLFNERNSNSGIFSLDSEKFYWVPLSVEFGIPLFSPKLCNSICNRVAASQLLQTDLLTVHHNALLQLRKRLRDICAEYQVTGPAAKLLYQRQQSKDSSRQLMTYASGWWNLDSSSPISGASSEHQRLKLANRQRCRTEILSFDGSILRSYALNPVYEAATRPVEESVPANTMKTESDDANSREVVLPGINLLFDGSVLHAFDIVACLQARQPVSLIADALATSAASLIR